MRERVITHLSLTFRMLVREHCVCVSYRQAPVCDAHQRESRVRLRGRLRYLLSRGWAAQVREIELLENDSWHVTPIHYASQQWPWCGPSLCLPLSGVAGLTWSAVRRRDTTHSPTKFNARAGNFTPKPLVKPGQGICMRDPPPGPVLDIEAEILQL